MKNNSIPVDIGPVEPANEVEQNGNKAVSEKVWRTFTLEDRINVMVYAHNPQGALYSAHDVMHKLGYSNHAEVI